MEPLRRGCTGSYPNLISIVNITAAFTLSSAVVTEGTLPLTCRLQLLREVKCCKWHEDYVKLRLVKTYLGRGTHWCDPKDPRIRFLNFLRKLRDLDYDVPPSEIKEMHTGDILIMSGRHRTSCPPVLHRSPPLLDEGFSHKRLLYSITVD